MVVYQKKSREGGIINFALARHGHIGWVDGDGCREERIFDEPSGQFVTREQFLSLKTERARERCRKYQLEGRKFRKDRSSSSHRGNYLSS